MVRSTGLEPVLPKAPPPQDGMSTNFTTTAHNIRKKRGRGLKKTSVYYRNGFA